ncbi:aromatic prenyltransferase [Mycena galericulata]|nr:aromatic prenyltransferase [Mycena galericulata]
MSIWWDTVGLPIISFMRHAKYPEDAVHAYTSLLLNEILPLLEPDNPAHPSWMTDDHTPVEFSLILGKTTKSSVRFAFEPSALPLAGERSITVLRHTLEHLASVFPMKPKFNLDWFDICTEELLLPDAQKRNNPKDHPVSEIFLGFDCAQYSGIMKVYFMPRIRSFVWNESPEEMMKRVTDRLGLAKPWAKISQFLSRFFPGDRPGIEIVAIDCVPGSLNRLKIYFRTNLLSHSHMEYFLTLGGALSTPEFAAGLQNAKLAWNAMTNGSDDGLPTQTTYFPSGLIYYELKQGDDDPSSKVYLPVQRYLQNDLATARSIEQLACQIPNSSVPNTYSDFMQTVFPHRSLSARAGIHTYVGCTVKPGGGDISLYYCPEAFAPERTTSSESARTPCWLYN